MKAEKVICDLCQGSGFLRDGNTLCPACNGEGMVTPFVGLTVMVTCDLCEGTGLLDPNTECHACMYSERILEKQKYGIFGLPVVARIAVYGTLGADASVLYTGELDEERNTTTANLAVALPPYQETIWFSVIAYGRIADKLAMCKEGEAVSIEGELVSGSLCKGNDEFGAVFSIVAENIPAPPQLGE